MAPSLSLFTRRKTSTAAAATAADDRALRAALSSPSFAHPPPTSAGSTASAEDFTRPGSGSHSPASAPATTKTKLPKTPLSAAAFGIPGGLYSPGFFGQSLGSATRTRTMTAAVDHPSASLARSNSDVSSTHRRSGSLDVRLPASWSRSERDREQKPPPPRKSYTSPALAPPSSPPRIPTSGSSGSNSPVGGMSAGRAAGKKRKDNVPGLPPHPSPVVSTSNAVVGHHHHHNNHHHHMPQSAPSTPGMPLSGGGPRKVSLPMLPMSPPLSPDSPGAGSGSAGLMKRSERELMLEIASLKQALHVRDQMARSGPAPDYSSADSGRRDETARAFSRRLQEAEAANAELAAELSQHTARINALHSSHSARVASLEEAHAQELASVRRAMSSPSLHHQHPHQTESAARIRELEELLQEQTRLRETAETELVQERRKRDEAYRSLDHAWLSASQQRDALAHSPPSSSSAASPTSPGGAADLHALYSAQIQKLEHARSSEAEAHRIQLGELRRSKERVEARVAELADEMARRNTAVLTQRSGNEELVAMVRKINARLAEEKRRNRQLEASVTAVSEDSIANVTAAKLDTARLRSALDDADEAHARVEAELRATQRERAMFEVAWTQAQAEAARIAASLADRDERIHDLEDESGELRDALEQARAKEELYAELASTTTSPITAPAPPPPQEDPKIKELQRDISLYKQDIKLYLKDVRKRDHEIASLRNTIATLESRLAERESEASHLRESLDGRVIASFPSPKSAQMHFPNPSSTTIVGGHSSNPSTSSRASDDNALTELKDESSRLRAANEQLSALLRDSTSQLARAKKERDAQAAQAQRQLRRMQQGFLHLSQQVAGQQRVPTPSTVQRGLESSSGKTGKSLSMGMGGMGGMGMGMGGMGGMGKTEKGKTERTSGGRAETKIDPLPPLPGEKRRVAAPLPPTPGHGGGISRSKTTAGGGGGGGGGIGGGIGERSKGTSRNGSPDPPPKDPPRMCSPESVVTDRSIIERGEEEKEKDEDEGETFEW